MARFFIDRPVFAMVMAIIIVIVGAVAIPTLPIATYPEVVPPVVQVIANYRRIAICCQTEFESALGSQILLFHISAIRLIPLRTLERLAREPLSESVTPSRTRTRFRIVIDISLVPLIFIPLGILGRS